MFGEGARGGERNALRRGNSESIVGTRVVTRLFDAHDPMRMIVVINIIAKVVYVHSDTAPSNEATLRPIPQTGLRADVGLNGLRTRQVCHRPRSDLG